MKVPLLIVQIFYVCGLHPKNKVFTQVDDLLHSSRMTLPQSIRFFDLPYAARKEDDLEFPEGFSIGAASAAYQIEGAWNVSDKSESVFDHRFHTGALLAVDRTNGDIACDFYHKYREDVQLAKNIGLNHFRFSISWSRVLPTGSPDRISKDGIQYYKNLIDELLNNGIEPFVTLHHFDDVQPVFEKTGGWANESMVEYFAKYARVMFRELGSKVKFWNTINEIDIYCRYYAYLNENSSDIGNTNRYLCAHNLLKAHARAYHIYDEEFRPTQHGQIGLVVNSGYYIPKLANDTESADTAFAFEAGWIMDPVFSKHGGYPEVMKQRIAENSKAEGLTYSRLPEFFPFWTDYIKGSSDYLGLNHYITALVESTNKTNGRWLDDSGIIYSRDPRWRVTAREWAIVPESIGALLRKIKKTFDNPTVYIMENGMSECSDLLDIERISYLYSYMKEVLLAVRDGCDVRAYTVWSLLDDFEYFDGYTQPHGLVHVDFKDVNRKRTPKLSSYWLKTVIEERKLISYNRTILDMLESNLPKNGVGGKSPCQLHMSIVYAFLGILSMIQINLT